MDGTSYEVLGDPGALAGLRPLWQRLWAETRPVPPMLEHGWVDAWWRLHAAEGHLAVVVVRDAAGEPAGIAPLYVRRKQLDPARLLRTVAFLGTGEAERDEVAGEYLGWLARPEAVPLVTAAVARYLSSCRDRWDRVLLANVIADQSVHQDLPGLLGGAVADSEVEERATHAMPVMPIDDYVARLPSANFRHRCRRALRAGADAGVALVEARDEGEASVMLRALAELHQQRWRSRGRPGAFASPVFTAFQEAVLPVYVRQGQGWLAGLKAGSRWLAVRYHLRAGDRLFDYLSGVDADGPAALAPGLLLSLLAVDWAREHGVTRYDLMAGDYEYKRRLGLESGRLVTLDLFGRSAAAALWLRLRRWRRTVRAALQVEARAAG